MAKIIPPFVRSPYNYDLLAASDESGLACLDESLAVQSEAEDCDINVIVERFNIVGSLPSGVRAPVYGDFVGVHDYQSAMNAIISADSSFMELPANIRSRFDNDPAKFVDFCSDPANRDEAIALGMVMPPQAALDSSVAIPASTAVSDPVKTT